MSAAEEEIRALRSAEDHQTQRMAEVDVLARGVAHLPFTVMVTPQMPEGTWGIGKRVSDNEVRFVVGPHAGMSPRGKRPPIGCVMLMAMDVARRMGQERSDA